MTARKHERCWGNHDREQKVVRRSRSQVCIISAGRPGSALGTEARCEESYIRYNIRVHTEGTMCGRIGLQICWVDTSDERRKCVVYGHVLSLKRLHSLNILVRLYLRYADTIPS